MVRGADTTTQVPIYVTRYREDETNVLFKNSTSPQLCLYNRSLELLPWLRTHHGTCAYDRLFLLPILLVELIATVGIGGG